MKENGLKRGQPITFRIPSDTSDHTLKQLQKMKEVEKRNFSSKVAEYVIDGVNNSLIKHREAITIPLPKGLNKAQRDWLKHEQSEALLGSIVYQLMSDPIRTAALFASLNSNAIEIDKALYLQEEARANEDREMERVSIDSEMSIASGEGRAKEHMMIIDGDDDLDDFDWEKAKNTVNTHIEEEIEEVDPLGDFLAQMNK